MKGFELNKWELDRELLNRQSTVIHEDFPFIAMIARPINFNNITITNWNYNLLTVNKKGVINSTSTKGIQLRPCKPSAPFTKFAQAFDIFMEQKEVKKAFFNALFSYYK